ncbi:hypothetical protein K4F52_001062 [Lecanicillium sp. MT-2017a]|nr:hypothetical protein K4F52_001062 [Lecanicillium sp. MT-2017a]
MGIRSKFTSSPSYHDSWEDIVSIWNPAKGRSSCVGYAETRGRRCWNQISASRVASATALLQCVEDSDSDGDTRSTLRRVARAMLCFHHIKDEEDIVREWMRKHTGPSNVQNDWDELYEKYERLRRQFAEFEHWQRSNKSKQPHHHGSRWQDAQHAGEGQHYKRESSEPFSSRPQQPKSRQDASHRESTSNHTRGEKKQHESQTWPEAWKRYAAKWKSLDADPDDKDVKIPWPTKSGLLRDVSETNVRQFYLKGPGELKSGKERYDMMSAETKRWHTDKIVRRFGADVMIGEHKEAFNTIARVVVDLWKVARAQKST